MILTLDSFEKGLYDLAYAGKRWIYVPRTAGQQFALAIVVVGRAGKTEIPAEICSSNDFEELASYAKLLNSEREARWQTGESRAIPEVA